MFNWDIRDCISKVSIFRIIVDLCEHVREVIHTPTSVYGIGLRQETLEYLCRRRLCKLKEKDQDNIISDRRTEQARSFVLELSCLVCASNVYLVLSWTHSRRGHER